MLIKRYKIEGYEDIVHRFHYFCHTELYVEKYNMVIRLNGNKIMFVAKSTNVHSLGFEEEYKIEEVNIDDNFIISCYTLLQKQNEMDDYKDTIHKSFDFTKILSNDELSKKMCSDARCEYDKKNYVNSIELYKNVVDFTHNQIYKYESLYNIACCYSRLEKYTESIQYLNRAYDNGFYDWEYVLSDKDFNDFDKLISINKTLFFDVIKKMLEKNPIDLNKYKNYKTLPPILSRLKNENIFPNTQT